MNGKRIEIIGAGVAGLTASIALMRLGADVTLYEQAQRLDPVGAGLQISPNGAAVLQTLGVELPSVENRAVALHDGLTARRVLRMDLSRARSSPFLLVHRADLIAALFSKAEALGVTFAFGTARHARDGDADLVIGADGVKSALRSELNPGDDAFFTGQVAWRAIIDDPVAAPEAQVFMGPGRHLVTYPLVGGRRNLVAVEERAEWAAEGWDHADDPANLRRAFADYASDVQSWLEQVTDVKLWGLFRHPVAQVWQDGRRVVIGDAAHPTLPFLAQGANLALEDAFLLARALGAEPIGFALARFQAQRLPRVSRAIRAANGNARNYHLSHPLVRWGAHSGLRIIDRLAPSLMLRQFDWLYGFDPTASD